MTYSDTTNHAARPAPTPRISFGLPIRNAESELPQTIESILAQRFEDWELVICDNESTDDSEELVQRYASTDGRIRYIRNEKDVGQIENFNKVLREARGEIFRWLGAGDRLHPDYAARVTQALEQDVDAIGATSLWEFVGQDGERQTSDYSGQRLESSRRLRRLARYLHFQTEDRTHLDPIYSAYRRDVMMSTHRLRISENTDHVLSFELLLQGPIQHVPEILATRALPPRENRDKRAKTYHASLRGKKLVSYTSRYREFRQVLDEQDMGFAERWSARMILAYYERRSRPYVWLRRQRARAGRFLRRLLPA